MVTEYSFDSLSSKISVSTQKVLQHMHLRTELLTDTVCVESLETAEGGNTLLPIKAFRRFEPTVIFIILK